MSMHSAKYRLTSCKVTKNLIFRIENFILSRAEEQLSISQGRESGFNFEELKKDLFHVYIVARFESMRLASIAEYDENLLPYATKTVFIEFHSIQGNHLHIRVMFHSSFSEHPAVEISVSGPNSREICESIGSGVQRIVLENKTINHIFHNRYFLVGLLFLFSFTAVASFFMITIPNVSGPFVISYSIFAYFIFALIGFWLIVSILVRPYIVFDTKEQKIYSIGYYIFSGLYYLLIVLYVTKFFNRIHYPW